MVNTETIDKLFLELGQFTQARTARELMLEARIRTLESACEAALTTLQSIQWVDRGDHRSCAGCGNWNDSGHHPECPIRTAIKQLEGAIKHG